MNTLLVAILASVIAGCLVTIFRSEWEGLSPRVAKAFKRIALKLAPAELRERLDEEWESVLNDMPSPLSKIFAAIGFCIAGIRLSPPNFSALPNTTQRVSVLVATNVLMGMALVVSVKIVNTAAVRIFGFERFHIPEIYAYAFASFSGAVLVASIIFFFRRSKTPPPEKQRNDDPSA